MRRFRIEDAPGSEVCAAPEVCNGLQSGLLSMTDWSDDDIEDAASLKVGESKVFNNEDGKPWVKVTRLEDR